MTTNNITLTQRGKAVLEWLKERGEKADKNRTVLDSVLLNFYSFDTWTRLFQIAFYVMLFSGLAGMATAWLLAFPNGVAGFIASLAVASGMSLENFIPAFGFQLVVMFAFFVYFTQAVASLTKNPQEEQFYTVDDVVAMLIELDEKISDIDRRTQDDNLVPEVVANMDEKIDTLLAKFE